MVVSNGLSKEARGWLTCKVAHLHGHVHPDFRNILHRSRWESLSCQVAELVQVLNGLSNLLVDGFRKRGERIESAAVEDVLGQLTDEHKQTRIVTSIEEYDRVTQPCHRLGLGVRVRRRDPEGDVADREVVGVVRRRHGGEAVGVRQVLLVFPWQFPDHCRFLFLCVQVCCGLVTATSVFGENQRTT